MAVEEGRRIALHGAASESWGEEVADTLMESIAPSGHELATRQDVDGILAAMDAMDERWEERLAAMDQRWDDRLAAMDQRVTAMEQRWDDRITAMDQRWDDRITAMDQRWDERLGSMDHRLITMDQRWQAEGRALRAELVGAIERRVNDAITTQNRMLIISFFIALITIGGIAIGLN